MKSYYNTNKLKSTDLQTAEKKAETQEKKVMSIFKSEKRKMTASDVLDIYPDPAPLTSIRRAISNLKELGHLEKTEQMKTGIYGSPEHFYQLKNKQLNLF